MHPSMSSDADAHLTIPGPSGSGQRILRHRGQLAQLPHWPFAEITAAPT